jgi:hypothetical protein
MICCGLSCELRDPEQDLLFLWSVPVKKNVDNIVYNHCLDYIHIDIYATADNHCLDYIHVDIYATAAMIVM